MKRKSGILAAFALSLVAFLGISGPALAHSDELETNPAAGATVEAGRIPITLTFGEELLTGYESIAHEIVITDSEKKIIPALCATAEGFDLTTAVAIDQPGEYQVTWRTVSEDGHPVSGAFKFEVVNTTDYDAATDAVDACVYAMLTDGQPIATDDETNLLNNFIFGAVTLVVLGGLALVFAKLINQSKRRKRKSE